MNILLLQGPLGTFFQSLSQRLTEMGHQVIKVHFNGGDAKYPCNGANLEFTNKPEIWLSQCDAWLTEYKIDAIVCYGDCRYYHKIAIQLCQKRNIDVWALEEGYLRQGYVTVEKQGVNANSLYFTERHLLPQMQWNTSFDEHHIIEKTFNQRAIFAVQYYFAVYFCRNKFINYQNHRPCSTLMELINWIKGGWTKFTQKPKDNYLLSKLKRGQNPLFLLPLQVNEDFQIIEHSEFDDLKQVIKKVIRSFAKFAAENAVLLIKHHPQDRGFTNYKQLIDSLAKELGLTGRIHYGYNFPLPLVYPLLTGTVTVNSTVGLSSLLHQVPTFCLGQAMYDIPKLTSQCHLNEFWKNPEPVCKETFENLKQSLLRLTQIQGNFYTEGEQTSIRIADKIVYKELLELKDIG